MKIGSFRLNEIKEMLGVVDHYEICGNVYTVYGNREEKLLVNISNGWYAYIHDHAVLYALEHINEFKCFKLR